MNERTSPEEFGLLFKRFLDDIVNRAEVPEGPLLKRLREHLGSPFVAGIPNRDILLCFRNDDETIDRLRDQIKHDYQSMPHQVTDKLMLVTGKSSQPKRKTRYEKHSHPRSQKRHHARARKRRVDPD